jgi:hypothetical protein
MFINVPWFVTAFTKVPWLMTVFIVMILVLIAMNAWDQAHHDTV